MSTENIFVTGETSGEGAGYLNDPDWWYDVNFPHSYTIFNTDALYPPNYFSKGHGVTEAMAKERYDFVLSHYGPSFSSIADFGSAGGWYLKPFQDNGFDALAVDGAESAREECLKRGVKNFVKADFRTPFDLPKKYDVVMCMDLAEHIEPPFAGTLVHSITKHADFVLFAAETDSIPNQPHYHHCNEVPYKYWVNLFKYFGFELCPHGGRTDWYIFKRTPKPEVFNGTQCEILHDCNIAIIRGDAGACSWVWQLRRLDYDRGMLDRIVPLIRKDMAVLDIGAFIGSHSFEYLKHASCVMSFEPNPAAFWCLSHNCPNAIRVNMALGDKITNRYWTRIYPNCGASYLSDEPSPDCLVVPVRPLDSFQLPPKIGYVKMDAEGEEVAILRGGRETFLRHRPTMCVEVNGAALRRTGTSPEELISTLHSYGYNTEPIWPGCDKEDQYDLIATHKEPPR